MSHSHQTNLKVFQIRFWWHLFKRRNLWSSSPGQTYICNVLTQFLSLTDQLMDILTNWISDNIHHSIHSPFSTSVPCSALSISLNNPSYRLQIKAASSGSHQFKPASLFYRLFFIQEREGEISDWFRVTLYEGWRRLKGKLLFWGGRSK